MKDNADDDEKWWDKLLKTPGNHKNWLKTDFDKWVDEDEQDEAPDMGNFGGDGMGMPGMGGPGGMDLQSVRRVPGLLCSLRATLSHPFLCCGDR